MTQQSQKGTVESPPDSNKTEYGKWYGPDGVKCCAIFVSWVYDHAGHPIEFIDLVNEITGPATLHASGIFDAEV